MKEYVILCILELSTERSLEMQGTKDRGAHAEYLSSMSEVVSGKRYSLGPGLKWSSKPWLRVEIFC